MKSVKFRAHKDRMVDFSSKDYQRRLECRKEDPHLREAVGSSVQTHSLACKQNTPIDPDSVEKEGWMWFRREGQFQEGLKYHI